MIEPLLSSAKPNAAVGEKPFAVPQDTLVDDRKQDAMIEPLLSSVTFKRKSNEVTALYLYHE